MQLPTVAQQYQHISKYSRFREDLGRRETWPESVERYMSFFWERNEGRLPKERFIELGWAFERLDAIGSMRALMTAGPALALDEVAAYNCSYVTMSRLEAWDEMMYLLMCGVGVGFSAEERYVQQLPVVPWEFQETDRVIVVPDSKIGWSESFRKVIKTLFAGYLPRWDMSNVRPAGSILHTFGGRASGPEPLDKLYRHCAAIIQGARGRRLTPFEAHSIACMVLDIVVVGGVRRAAGLDLVDRWDEKMLSSKSGMWFDRQETKHFGMANNSAVFYERPDAEAFMGFFADLVRNQSGEPGIFNRAAAQAQASRWGRRAVDVTYGCNPCGEIILRDRQLCNLSAAVARPSDDLETLKRKYGYAVDFGCMQAELTNFRYLSPQWKRNCEEERLAGASLDGIPDHPVLNGSQGKYELKKWLNELRDHGRRVAEHTSAQLGISVPTAIGTLKPAGNSSFLHGAPSPLKPHHAKFYLRRTRINKTDPVYHFLRFIGVPMEDEAAHPDTTAVITWPMRAPEGAATRDDWTALQQLKLWRTYRNEFCEHNPSVTINVKPHEWLEVAQWCWKHFDELTGVTFLPHDGGTYVQAPYEECSEGEFEELLEQMPTEVDWTQLQHFESEDTTTGAQELACSSGSCEIDLTTA